MLHAKRVVLLAAATTALAVVAVAPGAASAAGAGTTTTVWVAKRSCDAPRRGKAACFAMKLVAQKLKKGQAAPDRYPDQIGGERRGGPGHAVRDVAGQVEHGPQVGRAGIEPEIRAYRGRPLIHGAHGSRLGSGQQPAIGGQVLPAPTSPPSVNTGPRSVKISSDGGRK